MPLPVDWTVPSGFLRVPPREPTAARTRPPGCVASFCWTTTSVTTLARKQPFLVSDWPLHGPVGRLTWLNEPPPSVERYSPRPVASQTLSLLEGSTAALKPSAPSGTPPTRDQVRPPSVERYAPAPG